MTLNAFDFSQHRFLPLIVFTPQRAEKGLRRSTEENKRSDNAAETRAAAMLLLLALILQAACCDGALLASPAWWRQPLRSGSAAAHAGRAGAARAEAERQAAPVLSWRRDSRPETVVPTVSLTRSRDRTTGTATFRFDGPSVLTLHDVWTNGLITGLWLRDDEGELVSTDLDVTFRDGQPSELSAILVLKSAAEWDRFMRFMQRYAEANELAFESASG